MKTVNIGINIELCDNTGNNSNILLIVFQTLIFIRDKNSRGQEISGYIDYAHRLKTEDFEPYFAGKKRLLPRPSDLR